MNPIEPGHAANNDEDAPGLIENMTIGAASVLQSLQAELASMRQILEDQQAQISQLTLRQETAPQGTPQPSIMASSAKSHKLPPTVESANNKHLQE